jgi:hypothetical protein
VALSMEEQRILAEMERNLAADDPRLASRLTSFGQQRLPGTLSSQRVRTIAGLLALAMIAAVTVTMFMLSPYVNGRRSDLPRTPGTTSASAAPTATMHTPATGTAAHGKTGTGGKAGAGQAASSHRSGTKAAGGKTGKTGGKTGSGSKHGASAATTTR